MEFLNLTPPPVIMDCSFESTSTPEMKLNKSQLEIEPNWTFWGLLPIDLNSINSKYKCLIKERKKSVRFSHSIPNKNLKKWKQFKRAKYKGFKQWQS